MKTLALIVALSCTLCFATSIEYQVVAELKVREAHVAMLVAEIRSVHRGDSAFVETFDAAQKKWGEYCSEMLELRFPEKKKREEYGSADFLACAAVRRDMLDALIKDLLPFTRAAQRVSDDTPKKNG